MATPAVGEDIEALCGRCGQVWHVVMAKMGDRIAKVVCKRCGGHHGRRAGRSASGRAAPARVVLAKNLARSIRRGHPWIFRDALRTPPALPDGAPVTVTAPDGQPLARGFWDARSTIAVRVLEVAAAG